MLTSSASPLLVVCSPAEAERIGSVEQLVLRLEAGGGSGPGLATLLRMVGQDWHTATSEGRNEAEKERLAAVWRKAGRELNKHMMKWVKARWEQAA